jgi:hypothetical protein
MYANEAMLRERQHSLLASASEQRRASHARALHRAARRAERAQRRLAHSQREVARLRQMLAAVEGR